jgi:hypothetical protein
MDGHVWRIPTLLGAMAGSALLFFTAIVVASAIRRRRPSIAVRTGTSAALLLLAMITTIVLRATAALIARSVGINPSDVEPGILGYLAPVMFAAFAFAVGNWVLKGAWTSKRALRFTSGFSGLP